MQLEKAASLASFPKEFISRLAHPEREVRIAIPVRMDDGREEIFEGYRVEHNNARGPYKGGIRFHQDTDINEVKALAFWMTLKCSVAGIPMGGGKGGITVDPKKLSKNELEKLSRGWVRGMAPILGPHKDVPAPDVNTTGEIMGWMTDEFEKISGDTTRATFTGKLIEHGGSEGRSAATGLGGFYVFDELKEDLGISPGAKIVIQGFGNVGGFAAKIFSDHGYHVVAISDSKSAIVTNDMSPLDISLLEMHKKSTGTLDGFPNTKTITNEELLLLPCDVLIPAALENQITEDNASNIQAKVILELANGPTTPEADDILFQKNIILVPDILANAGGVTVSTFEWEQNLNGQKWTEEEVNNKLKKLIQEQARTIFLKSQALNADLRKSAFVVAMERLQKAMGF